MLLNLWQTILGFVKQHTHNPITLMISYLIDYHVLDVTFCVPAEKNHIKSGIVLVLSLFFL